MAEDRIESSFTLKTKLENGNPRRNSTGIVKGSSIGQSSSPNYLRASTGSCHEFCKYGKEHTFAVKARNPKPKRMTPPSDKQKNVETEVLAPKKKSLVGKPKPSPDVKDHSPRKNVQAVVLPERKKTLQVKLKPSPDLLHSPDPPEVIKQEISFPLKKVEVSSKQNSSNNKIVKDKEQKTTSTSKHSLASKSKSAMVRPSDSSNASVGSNGKRKPSTSPKIMGTSKTAVKKVLPPSAASLSPKSSASKIYTIMSRLKDQNRAGKVKTKILENEKVQEKTLHVVEAETVNNNLKSVQVDDAIQISLPKSSSDPDSQLFSSQGDGVEESEYFDKEDLQQFECTDTEDPEESDYCVSEADESISETDEIVNINGKDASDYSSRPKEGGATGFEDEDTALAKSKFRRGRIVDLNSDNNVPTKLRFRRGRVVGEDESKSYARRRNFKKGEVSNEASGTSPSSEKVVLRHQDMQGKKDAQGLFNNVIEETASKLVESRKSKVKALVGAFETVISLQETKPSNPTGI